MKRLKIGGGVTQIDAFAFYESPITECYCYATTPPDYSYGSIGGISSTAYHPFYNGINKKVAKLYVPERCGSTYRASWWGQEAFNNIIEMD